MSKKQAYMLMYDIAVIYDSLYWFALHGTCINYILYTAYFIFYVLKLDIEKLVQMFPQIYLHKSAYLKHFV